MKPPIIEHEEIIYTSNGTVKRSQLDALNAQAKARDEAIMKAMQAKADAQAAAKSCPLVKGMNPRCRMDACAWYINESCAYVCPHPATGKKCPHTGTACVADCAMRPAD